LQTITGLEQLIKDKNLQDKVKGNIGLLCHSASIDSRYQIAVIPLLKIFGPRLKKLFGPQHGFVSDVQDNMIESHDYLHPYFKIPVHSLYSHTRIPTDEMLEGLDTIIVDLQDVGTRVYTYIHTLTLLMEKCGCKGIHVIVLDRPNPVGGEIIEGNLLQKGFESFVGRHTIPMRHALTLAEIALYAQRFHSSKCQLTTVSMQNWKRQFFFEDTGLPWVFPSPNLPTINSAKTYVGTVLFEGTNISEGRGTTRSLEIVGHPKIEAFSFVAELNAKLPKWGLEGFIFRPLVFMPTFQKYQGLSCGGLQIHVTDNQKFLSWRLGQFLCLEFSNRLGGDFSWNEKPYEYQFEGKAIDFIHGTDLIRKWVENNGDLDQLLAIEKEGVDAYLNNRESILLY